MLQQRADETNPLRIALIGCGKFSAMYLTQARITPGIHVVGIAELNPERARANLTRAGWPDEQSAASSIEDALKNGTTLLTEDAFALIKNDQIDVVVEATGIPREGIRHCRAAIQAGHHVIMVNVEADVLAGPLLAREAERAGVVYSLAWGDQPALICEHIDWARSCGFEVTSAGKGSRYLPNYHSLTPDTVWDVLQQYLEIKDPKSINLQMFNSFLDGSKSAIEMTAVCNAMRLMPQVEGLGFPPASRFDLADTCKPKTSGGVLSRAGTTEVVSSLNRDGSPITHDLAMGTYVVVRPTTDYARQCFSEYHMLPDQSGEYGALYRPTHMIGLELGISVASAALRGEPTGSPVCFSSDVVAVAKRDLKAGEMLDGEGGFCVWGRQMPAALSVEKNALPLGLAGGFALKRDVPAGAIVCEADVALDESDEAVTVRRAMIDAFPPFDGAS